MSCFAAGVEKVEEEWQNAGLKRRKRAARKILARSRLRIMISDDFSSPRHREIIIGQGGFFARSNVRARTPTRNE